MKNQPSVWVMFLCQEDAVLQDRVPSSVQDPRLFVSIGTFDPYFLQNTFAGVKVCYRDSAEIKIHWMF